MTNNQTQQQTRPQLNLLVLRCRDIELTRLFYEGLNLHFISEQHGNGSRHYTAVMDNGLVLELYPAKGEPDNTRLGFHFGGKSQRVLQDPDGRYVEVWQ